MRKYKFKVEGNDHYINGKKVSSIFYGWVWVMIRHAHEHKGTPKEQQCYDEIDKRLKEQ